MGHSNSTFGYGGCRLEQELQAASDINSEVRNAVKAPPGASIVDAVKLTVERLAAADEEARVARLGRKSANAEITRLQGMVARKGEFINEAREAAGARSTETLTGAVRRLKASGHDAGEAAAYARLEVSWEQAAKDVGIVLDDNCDQTVSQEIRRAGSVFKRLTELYLDAHPEYSDKTVPDIELTFWVSNIMRRGNSSQQAEIKDLKRQLEAVDKRDYKVETYDDCIKALGLKRQGLYASVKALIRLEEAVDAGNFEGIAQASASAKTYRG